ncbi:hypothetical protein [Rufibacter sp. LB8]|uniref:hypothetical protein n=1 Tax=Rufibacter sp. LB8 TaxID=2777781 RepID=UPI00178C54ED|nr:hypothetical protein [Rufibacter sp. LB8]
MTTQQLELFTTERQPRLKNLLVPINNKASITGDYLRLRKEQPKETSTRVLVFDVFMRFGTTYGINPLKTLTIRYNESGIIESKMTVKKANKEDRAFGYTYSQEKLDSMHKLLTESLIN